MSHKHTRIHAHVRVLAMLLLLVVATAAPFLGTAAAAGGPPGGMTGVPSANIDDIRPSNAPSSVTASDLEGGVYVSRHASTTEVDLVTTAQAREVAKGASPSDIAYQAVCSSPASENPALDCERELALVISDDVHHEGRTVAVRVDVVEEALGRVPESLTVSNNETGEQWRAPATVEEGWLVAEVPHFSSNSVTWDGTFELSMTPATNGTTSSYDLQNATSVSDYTINITGSRATQWDNQTWTQTPGGSSLSVTAAGNVDPEGASINGEPTVTLTGASYHQLWKQSLASRGIAVAVDGENVYATGNDDTVRNFTGGTERWSVPLAHDGRAVATDGTHIYVSGHSGNVLKLNKDGTTVWNVSAGSGMALDVDSAGNVYVATYAGKVVKLNSTGSQQWATTVTTGEATTITLGGSENYVYAGTTNPKLVKLATSDGTESWNQSLSGDRVREMDTGPNGNIHYGVNHTLRKIDPTGTELWSVVHGSDVFTLAIDAEGSVYISERDAITRKFDDTGTEVWSASEPVRRDIDVNSNQRLYTLDNFGGVYSMEHSSDDPTLDLNGDGTIEVSYSGRLQPGESVTYELANLTTDDSVLEVTTANTTRVDISLEYIEVTETVDPTISVNGQTTGYTGTLADGTTESLATNTSWLQNGTNWVNVTVSPSVSADAPAPEVVVDYSHTATHEQSVSYEDEQWTSRYNVSKTYASDRTQAGLDISHKVEVVAVRNLEYRINESGGWTTATSGEYILSGNDLTVDVDTIYGGTVPAGTTFEIRSNASKVETHNVSIEVLEATPVGDPLNSKIQIKSISNGAYIGVGPTENGDRVHYLTDESWSEPSEYVIIDSAGNQELYLPNAGASDTARVTHLATDVSAQTGDVEVAVAQAGSEPQLEIGPGPSGSGDAIVVTHYDTVSGTTYLLKELEGDVHSLLDSEQAQSPVTLSTDDTGRLIGIFTGEESGSTGPGGDSGSGSGGGGASTVGSGLFVVLGVVLLTGIWFASHQYGEGRVSTRTYLGLAAAVIVVFGLEAISPASIVGGVLEIIAAFFGGATQAWPLIVIVGGGLVYYYLRQRGKPEKVYNFELGGGGK